MELKEYYPDIKDEWDADWPYSKRKSVHMEIFVDADHTTNKEDRRSITGLIIFINSAPYKWFHKRQMSVEASTFVAEYAALRIAVEEAVAVTHTLCSLGIPLAKPVNIYCDNQAVTVNSTTPGSILKKKHCL